MRTITREQLKQKIDKGEKFTLVDVLNPQQFNQVHIKGAVNIPLDKMTSEAPKRLNKSNEVVVYCSGPQCTMSQEAATTLTNLGFNVTRYEGGIQKWTEAQFPTEGSQPTTMSTHAGSSGTGPSYTQTGSKGQTGQQWWGTKTPGQTSSTGTKTGGSNPTTGWGRKNPTGKKGTGSTGSGSGNY